VILRGQLVSLAVQFLEQLFYETFVLLIEQRKLIGCKSDLV